MAKLHDRDSGVSPLTLAVVAACSGSFYLGYRFKAWVDKVAVKARVFAMIGAQVLVVGTVLFVAYLTTNRRLIRH